MLPVENFHVIRLADLCSLAYRELGIDGEIDREDTAPEREQGMRIEGCPSSTSTCVGCRPRSPPAMGRSSSLFLRPDLLKKKKNRDESEELCAEEDG